MSVTSLYFSIALISKLWLLAKEKLSAGNNDMPIKAINLTSSFFIWFLKKKKKKRLLPIKIPNEIGNILKIIWPPKNTPEKKEDTIAETAIKKIAIFL